MSAYFTNGVNVTQIHPTAEVFTYFSSLLIFGSLVASGLWLVFKWRGHVPKSFPMYLWLFLCGIIHVVIEGHLFRSSPLDRSMISSLWAEYSKGDIRYFTDDPVTFIIELMTYYLVSILCFASALLCLMGSEFRHVISIIASTMQLYGVVIYYYTGLHGEIYWSGEYYLKMYFLTANLPWAIVPLGIILTSSAKLFTLLSGSPPPDKLKAA